VISGATHHYNPPSHAMVFQFLEAARARVEPGLPPYRDLWQEPFEEEKQRFMEEAKKRVASYND
jgi:hypothetical protein